MPETVEYYLILHKSHRYAKPTARITKGSPALKKNEISIKMKVSVPSALFETPQLQAVVNLPDDRLAPEVFNLEVKQNLEEIISQNTGLQVEIVEKPKEEN